MDGGSPGYPKSEIIAPKPVVWLGAGLAAVRGFAPEAKWHAGQQLRRVQDGELPIDWKPMPTIGPGVNELRVRVGGAYRVVYVAKFAEAVYVLHAFEKKSRKTARLDVELARQRYRNLMRERNEWRKG
jgi:phage-related protein